MEKASFLLAGSVVSDGPRCQQGDPRQACDLKEIKARKARTDFKAFVRRIHSTGKAHAASDGGSDLAALYM